MTQSLRLLLVEDVEDDALLLVRELRKGGIDPDYARVETAEELQAALANAPWDAVFADYNLPAFTGLDALRIVREMGMHLPFILVSGAVGEETAVEALQAGANDYIMKGRYARLVPALERALREAALRRERELAQQEIEELNNDLTARAAELEAANAELEAFAYSVSHDLRAPLRAMGGFSEALLEDFGDRLEGEALTYLNEIVIGSRQMAQLIDGLLTLSRSTRGELRRDRMDLSEMVDRIRFELEQSERGRAVEWRIEPGLSARGDARMIELVMRNLLGNAWKFTKGVTEPIIRVYAERGGNERFICVADNGAGFDMAHTDKLFQPFQRLHRQDEFPGIGIGLATAQRIVHRHGGTIHATGAPHQGATFRFSLPYGVERYGEV